jgi:hypothetical protein
MQAIFQRLRPPALLILLALPLILPLTRGELPCTDDGQVYYYAAVATWHGVENGLIFSRWMPDAALGYGVPTYNYAEPLPRYVITAFYLLGLTLPDSMNLAAALALLVMGWGGYRLGRGLYGRESAGMLTALILMSAPFMLVNIYRRGALAELFGLAFLPWAFDSLWRSLKERGAGPVLQAAFALALSILSHNISTLIALPTLGVFVAVAGWLYRKDKLWPRPALGYLGGVGLGAFFFLPAYLERNAVQVFTAISSQNNSFANNFLSFGELFALPGPSNILHLNPPLTLPIGIGAVLLAGAGAWAVLHAAPPVDEEIPPAGVMVYFGALALLYLLMTGAISGAVYEEISILRFVQFPWRFVGRAALPLAALAGGAVLLLPADRRRRWMLPVGGGLIAVFLLLPAMAFTYPVSWCPSEPYPGIANLNRFEQTGLFGIDNESSYLPIAAVKAAETPLLADYAAGRTPQRFDPAALPEGAAAVADYHPLGADVRVESPSAFRARYLSYAFPGWRVWADGERVPVYAEAGSGLIVFDLPAGTHDVRIRFGATPIRAAANGLSLLALVGLGVVYFRLRDGPRDAVQREGPGDLTESAFWITLALLGLTLALLRMTLPETVATPWRAAIQPGPELPLNIVFEGQVTLLGYDLDAERLHADDPLRVTTTWTRSGPMPDGRDTDVTVGLIGPDGLAWNQREVTRGRAYEAPPFPTFFWPEGTFATQPRVVRFLPGTPPGEYILSITLYDADTLQPLTIPRDGGGVRAQATPGSVQVVWPEASPTLDALGIQYPGTVETDTLTLLGYNLDREQARPGDSVLVTVFWRNTAGHPLATGSAYQLTAGDALLREQTGERLVIPAPRDMAWRDQALVRLPLDAPPGPLIIELGIADQVLALRPIDIAPLERLLQRPGMDLAINEDFSGLAGLIGLDLAPGEGTLRVTLAWEALTDLPTTYVVFVHALDESGTLLAQSDALPGGGTRPTTGWLPGEFILDTHTLRADPTAVAALRVGLYDPATGIRVELRRGGDALLIPLR